MTRDSKQSAWFARDRLASRLEASALTMKKTQSLKLQLNSQTIRTLEKQDLAQANGGILTLSAQTNCRACDSYTVPITRCM